MTSQPETQPGALPERARPPYVASEREMLDAWLDFHRATLLRKCHGLTDAQLKARAVPPSSLSLLGLVRHMTDVERNWFRRVLDDEAIEPTFWLPGNEDGDFDDVDTADVAADLDAYREMVATCRARAVGRDLEDMGRRKSHGHDVSLRWIYVHMIEEYARHNGHADLLRESIDGSTGS